MVAGHVWVAMLFTAFVGCQSGGSSAPLGTMDPLFGDEWHLLNIGQEGGIPGEDINVIPVWNSGLRGEGIRIAVVDDGLEIAHEDLTANIATGLSHNYLDGGSNPTCP
ncbi:MAG: hypothetical protein OEM95_06700, partial [Gammaproteobacteria bacterium]|nr:hypothetical protein [Gammaproteobacteria bacterium]